MVKHFIEHFGLFNTNAKNFLNINDVSSNLASVIESYLCPGERALVW